jgi:hypothetical protein
VAGLVATRPVWTQVGLRDHIVATMAGPLAEGQELQWPPDRFAGGDEDIVGMLVWALGLAETDWWIAELQAQDILDKHRDAFRDVARALRERGVLSGDEVRRIVEEAKPPPRTWTVTVPTAAGLGLEKLRWQPRIDGTPRSPQPSLQCG